MLDVNIHCIIFGVSEKFNKKCILSTKPDDIVFPVMSLNDENLGELTQNIVIFLKQYILVNDLALMPQIITINSKVLNIQPNTLDIVFGFIVDYTANINDNMVYWLNFDPMIEHKLSPIIFETIQKLV